jgi:Protein of unknown function (DUF2911)
LYILFAMMFGSFSWVERTMRTFHVVALLLYFVAVPFAFSQAATSDESAVCVFEDGRQMTARYIPVPAGHSEGPPTGKIWTPNNNAWTLFTESDLMLGNTSIPTGAYTLYLLPGKKDWTLIVSRNTDIDGKYDEKRDLARAQMEIGQLSTPADKLSLYFGHTGQRKCEINVDFGKLRGWVEFRQK